MTGSMEGVEVSVGSIAEEEIGVDMVPGATTCEAGEREAVDALRARATVVGEEGRRGEGEDSEGTIPRAVLSTDEWVEGTEVRRMEVRRERRGRGKERRNVPRAEGERGACARYSQRRDTNSSSHQG